MYKLKIFLYSKAGALKIRVAPPQCRKRVCQVKARRIATLKATKALVQGPQRNEEKNEDGFNLIEHHATHQ
jgi:hypothetical protein